MTDSRLSGRENRLCTCKTCSASSTACPASSIACRASPTACSASLLRYLICRHHVLPSLERAFLSGDRALPAPLVVFRASVRSHYLYSRALTSDQLQLHGMNALQFLSNFFFTYQKFYLLIRLRSAAWRPTVSAKGVCDLSLSTGDVTFSLPKQWLFPGTNLRMHFEVAEKKRTDR